MYLATAYAQNTTKNTFSVQPYKPNANYILGHIITLILHFASLFSFH